MKEINIKIINGAAQSKEYAISGNQNSYRIKFEGIPNTWDSLRKFVVFLRGDNTYTVELKDSDYSTNSLIIPSEIMLNQHSFYVGMFATNLSDTEPYRETFEPVFIKMHQGSYYPDGVSPEAPTRNVFEQYIYEIEKTIRDETEGLTERVKEKILQDFSPIINAKADKTELNTEIVSRQAGDQTLQNKIEQEALERTSADNTINEEIDFINLQLSEKASDTDLTNEINIREYADERINNQIKDLNNKKANADDVYTKNEVNTTLTEYAKIAYVNEQDNATLESAKEYTDSKASGECYVHDVKVDGESVVSDKVANINLSDKSNATNLENGVGVNSLIQRGNSGASGKNSLVVGINNSSLAQATHIEGYNNIANAEGSHIEGSSSVSEAKAKWSHIEGVGNTSNLVAQHVQGKYSDSSVNNMAHIVGGGSSNTDRKNIHTLDWSGNAWFSGDVSTPKDKLSEKVNKATSLSGYGINDAYTKTEVDSEIVNSIANKMDIPNRLDNISEPLVINTVYTLGVQEELLLNLPNGDNIGDYIKIGFTSGEIPTNLTIISLSETSGLDLVPVTNKVYNLTFTWDKLNDGYGWIIVYTESDIIAVSNGYLTDTLPLLDNYEVDEVHVNSETRDGGSGLSFFINNANRWDNGMTIARNRGGKWCRTTIVENRGSGGYLYKEYESDRYFDRETPTYMYFKVDNSILSSEKRVIRIVFDYYDDSKIKDKNIQLNYLSYNDGGSSTVSSKPIIKISGSDSWKNANILITNAQFDHNSSGLGGFDFSIGMENTEGGFASTYVKLKAI